MKDITTEEATKIIKNFIDYFNKNKDDGNKANLCVLGEEIKAIEKVLNELDTYKHYYEELTTGQVQSSQLLKKYVIRDELEKKDEIICKATKCEDEGCKNCIKQYFEKEVKDE